MKRSTKSRQTVRVLILGLGVALMGGLLASSPATAAVPIAGTAGVVTAPESVPDKLRSKLAGRAIPELRALTAAVVRRDINTHKAKAKSRLRQLKKQARTTAHKRIVASAERQLRATEQKYRKATRATARGFWIPAILIAARLMWAGRSAGLAMLATCMKAKSCSTIVIKGAEKVTASTVAVAMAAGQKKIDCFWHQLATIPLVKCLLIGKK